MKIPLYQFDAFTRRRFGGNPAAICFLDEWLDAEVMQQIAAENNVSETAFFVGCKGSYDLRWFTPEVEVDLCGHATLATAHLVLNHLEPNANEVCFHTMSGDLTVTRQGEMLSMIFPARPPTPIEMPSKIANALGGEPSKVFQSRDMLALFDSERQIRDLSPDFDALVGMDAGFAFIVTAPGDEVDFVSRFFAPGAGIPEDPVTGSAHCTLIPFWSSRLDKAVLHAKQVSNRGGELFCEHLGEKVRISGFVTEYSHGHIFV
jgi:PhzF family phenazine biosynthesis protein